MDDTLKQDVIELLQSMKIIDNSLFWSQESYHLWLDKFSHVKESQRALYAHGILDIVFRMRSEMPINCDDVTTKLYTCINLLGQGLAKEKEQEPAEREGILEEAPQDENQQEFNPFGDSLFSWFQKQP